ncbi:Glycosyltransferase involved in cell wall bisynthesis [Pseudoxanthobacter soli DSM 19599]|uniref:Glycosyltransferase involved in cell wall bisynthesis n=1 Tax=Pseudoxanthobacter soli DSM 19599 TaxID=1123029 RepID=A0A1M7ZPX0_9HYPH|nr:glycosyltransferase family 1 protein [Pseudoxanthobacter soli]SHO66859.1 Glycosyltransferase involved in cell wall bisynthesis [Pseudoxanthobacter soli DSM 19599]
MRVAVMAWYGPKFRGVWNYYLNMARVLRAHAPGCQVCIFHAPDLEPRYRAEVEEATGEPGREMPVASRLADAAALFGLRDRQFARCCEAAGIDVVFEQARFLGRNYPLPVLPWIGDLQHRALPHYFTRRHRLQRDIGFRAQVTFRKHAVVSSQSARSDLLRFIPEPRAKIHVVPFALRLTEEVTPGKIERARRDHGIEGRYLFLPNQLWRHKNHMVALRAFALLAARGFDRTLVLSGGRDDFRHPHYPGEVAALEASLGVSERLRWLGLVPYADLLSLVADADALLNPSLFEGWSTTVEEAKTLGAPMVLSDIDVHREQAGHVAKLFDPADPEAMAGQIEAAVAAAPTDREAARAAARLRNLDDQKTYAGRLSTALEEAVRDFR